MASNTHAQVALRMYRILRKQCRLLRPMAAEAAAPAAPFSPWHDALLIQTRPDPRANGTSQIFSMRQAMSEKESRESLYRFFAAYDYMDRAEDWLLHDWLEDLLEGWYYTLGTPVPQSLWTSHNSLSDAIKYAFRSGPSVRPETKVDQALYTQWAIDLYRLLQDQQRMQQTVSMSLEHDVRIIATSQYIGRTLSQFSHMRNQSPRRHVVGDKYEEEEDDDDDDLLSPKFRFAYRIRVENQSPTDTIQLLGRTWNIQETTAEGVPLGDPIRVHAPRTGAVGKLPVLHPGQVFEYSSQCELVTPTGEMKV